MVPAVQQQRQRRAALVLHRKGTDAVQASAQEQLPQADARGEWSHVRLGHPNFVQQLCAQLLMVGFVKAARMHAFPCGGQMPHHVAELQGNQQGLARPRVTQTLLCHSPLWQCCG